MSVKWALATILLAAACTAPAAAEVRSATPAPTATPTPTPVYTAIPIPTRTPFVCGGAALCYPRLAIAADPVSFSGTWDPEKGPPDERVYRWLTVSPRRFLSHAGGVLGNLTIRCGSFIGDCRPTIGDRVYADGIWYEIWSIQSQQACIGHEMAPDPDEIILSTSINQAPCPDHYNLIVRARRSPIQ